jgi:seryl-tRNA synthetase
VRLTVGGVHQTVPLHVAADPRQHVPEDAFTKQLALELEVRDRITQLHHAVNEIRDLKSQIDSLHHRFANNQAMRQALDVTKNLKEKISAVEEQLIQVNMKGSEANLAFPNMLNEELDTFSNTIDQADAVPTASQYDVFRMLSAKLDEQLGTWAHIQKDELPAVNNLVRASQIPVLTVQDGESEAANGK